MTPRHVVPVLAAAVLLMSCTGTTDATDGQPLSSPTSPAEPSPTEQPVVSSDAVTPPSVSTPNRLAVKTGVAILRKGGVRAIAEAEPPHGDPDAELTGRWGGHLVIAHVAPHGVRLVPGKVLAREETGGVEVLTMDLKGRRTVLRFQYGDHVIDLQVVTENLDFPERQTALLLSGILCPSECGDLPPGADE